MPFLGDLERFAATTLYPWRFAIAALAIAATAGFVALAIRRGWFAAARRHPGRTGVLVAAVVVVLAPAAWYLGSPLFIRTELQEPPPAAVGAGATAEPSASPTLVPSPTQGHRSRRQRTRRLAPHPWPRRLPRPSSAQDRLPGPTSSTSDAAAPP